jgi:hypothetical protein
MSTTLNEVCILRANELTRILAGCIAIDPVTVLPMLAKMHDGVFTDANARLFILSMRNNYFKLQKMDDEQQIASIMKIIKQKSIMMDYLSWLAIIPSIEVKNEAATAIKELKRLAITLDTIGDLQVWYRENVEAYNERR